MGPTKVHGVEKAEGRNERGLGSPLALVRWKVNPTNWRQAWPCPVFFFLRSHTPVLPCPVPGESTSVPLPLYTTPPQVNELQYTPS